MTPSLRSLASSDGPAALGFWRTVPGLGLSSADEPDELERFLARNPGLSYGAFTPEGQVVATALAGHDGRRGFLYHVAVAPPVRGQGLSRELVDACLAALQAEGIRKVHLFVLADNVAGLDYWSAPSARGWLRRGDLVVFSRDL
jgi:ribosomal protein S18 acetylase RimI-like enzyme